MSYYLTISEPLADFRIKIRIMSKIINFKRSFLFLRNCGIRTWHTKCTHIRISISHKHTTSNQIAPSWQTIPHPGKSVVRLHPPEAYQDTCWRQEQKVKEHCQTALATTGLTVQVVLVFLNFVHLFQNISSNKFTFIGHLY